MTHRWIALTLCFTGCAQLQAQRQPSWIQAETAWTAERLICMGHSGADGGVRAADYAAARCTAGYGKAWIEPAVAAAVEDAERRERIALTLLRLAKVSDRYTDPGTGQVTSRMQLTFEELDRQAQRELEGEAEALERLRKGLKSGPAPGVSTAPVDPKWAPERWAKLRPAATPPPAAAPEEPAADQAPAAESAADKAPTAKPATADKAPTAKPAAADKAPAAKPARGKKPKADAEPKATKKPADKPKKKKGSEQDAPKPKAKMPASP